MARAYSDDLRRKFLERHGLGEETLEELAQLFCVSVGWARKVSASYTRTGQMERPASGRRGRKPKATPEVEAWIRAAVKSQADVTLAELQVGLYRQQQLEISIGALWNTLRRLNLRLKKNHSRG